MSTAPAFDHIALTVPDVEAHVDRLTKDFGMEARFRTDQFALVVDPVSGFRFEISRSEDDGVHLRHLGFRADDVDASHAALVAAGMDATNGPHRQDFAGMYTSYLREPGGLEVQLVTYDD